MAPSSFENGGTNYNGRCKTRYYHNRDLSVNLLATWSNLKRALCTAYPARSTYRDANARVPPPAVSRSHYATIFRPCPPPTTTFNCWFDYVVTAYPKKNRYIPSENVQKAKLLPWTERNARSARSRKIEIPLRTSDGRRESMCFVRHIFILYHGTRSNSLTWKLCHGLERIIGTVRRISRERRGKSRERVTV